MHCHNHNHHPNCFEALSGGCEAIGKIFQAGITFFDNWRNKPSFELAGKTLIIFSTAAVLMLLAITLFKSADNIEEKSFADYVKTVSVLTGIVSFVSLFLYSDMADMNKTTDTALKDTGLFLGTVLASLIVIALYPIIIEIFKCTHC